tara:strand:+ start:3533 stop:3763 length:231 start_codon:yes stop_codon:yes gene_type:complete
MSVKSNVNGRNLDFSPVVSRYGFRGIVSAAASLILQWQGRAAERRHLADLDKHDLTDVGLTFADVRPETEKPFWQS